MTGLTWEASTPLSIENQACWIEDVVGDDVRIRRVADQDVASFSKSTLDKLYWQGAVRRGLDKGHGSARPGLPQRIELPASLTKADLEHANWLKPYVDAFNRKGSLRHACKKELVVLIAEVATLLSDEKPPAWRTLSNVLKRQRDAQAAGMRSAWGAWLATDIRARGNRSDRFIQEVEDLIETTITADVLKPDGDNMKTLHAKVTHFVEKLKSTYESFGELRAPSRRTLERRVRNRSAFSLVEAKEGRQAADAKCLVVKPREMPSHPLEFVEIDHTPVDVLLVHHETRSTWRGHTSRS